MRFLFVKRAMRWPRSTGDDVYTFHLMQALNRLGHPTAFAVHGGIDVRAVDGAGVVKLYNLEDLSSTPEVWPPRLTRLQRRLSSYWGVEAAHMRATLAAARDHRADVVVACGLSGLPHLASAEGCKRVWYAADEEAHRHLSQLRAGQPSSWAQLRSAIVVATFERTFRIAAECIWVVSPDERRRMRRIVGARHVEVLTHGVDTDYFTPVDVEEIDYSCVFWGRLDFEPNVQALAWFLDEVWPRVRRAEIRARFDVFGFNPSPRAVALMARDGVSLVRDLPDLRDAVSRRSVVVLPFVSGGGVKTKLLEAAALGRAIVATPRACSGLRGADLPIRQVSTADQWQQALQGLWREPSARRALGAAARDWVVANHTWAATAREALRTLAAAP